MADWRQDDTSPVFRECLALADEMYTQKGVLTFFNGANELLGGERPIDLFKQGRGQEVLDLLRGNAEGVFS